MSRNDQSQGPGIGATLKDARRRLGMDIKEAEERTKIRTRYLRALEAEDWEVLPAPAYVRGFLRTYGQLLGLDGGALADRYRRSFEEPAAAAAPPEPVLRNRRGSGSRPPSRNGWIAAIAVAVALLVVILAVIGLTAGDDEPARIKDAPKQNGKSGGGGDGKEERKPIDVRLEPLTTIRICLVGGGDPLIDSQVLAAGASEEFSGEKRYRLDIVGGGTVRFAAGEDEEKLEADDDASFEADQDGIREIEYAGPECP
jgi:hypothetical protein